MTRRIQVNSRSRETAERAVRLRWRLAHIFPELKPSQIEAIVDEAFNSTKADVTLEGTDMREGHDDQDQAVPGSGDSHGDTGWYQDPFDQHQARWMSEGRPTDLVMDDGFEGHDPAPPFDTMPELRELPPARPSGPDDLRRADRNTRVDQSVQPGDGARAVEAAGEMGLRT